MSKFNYSKNNLYFITICVKKNFCCLSTINSTKNNTKHTIELTIVGVIINNQIEKLKSQYPYIEIHNYIVMPNHIHLIIELNPKKAVQDDIPLKSVYNIITPFKNITAKLIKGIGVVNFSWQRTFHEYVIKDYDAYLDISEHISTNHQNWEKDTFFTTSTIC